MVYRLFIDLETTGPGESKYNDIIELNAELQTNGGSIKQFSARYSYLPTTVFTGGMNRHKAEKFKREGHKNPKEGLEDFIKWLDTNLGKNKAFLVSYNCEFDFRHLKN